MQIRSENADCPLDIRLFGTFSILDARGQLIALQGRKNRAVLAYLSMHPGVAIARDRMVELMWPDALGAGGRASLRQALSTIRKAFPEDARYLLIAERDAVTLCAEGLSTDVGALEAAGSGPVSNSRYIPVFEGTLLDGLTGVSAAFDNWRRTEEARISVLYCQNLSDQAELAQQEKRFADVAALLSRAIAIDPFAEPVSRKLMQAHLALGRPDSALRHYRSLEVLLETELGARPERETQELVREIRASRNTGEPPVPTAPPTQTEIGAELERPAVLVTPFLESDREDDFFANSFTESVILALTRFPETPVVDLKTVRIASSGHSEDPLNMASAVGAKNVLSGTIRRANTRLRINARLTDASTGRTIWAEKYDRAVVDITEIEDDLSAHVATAITGKIEEDHQRRARKKPTADLEVIDLVMRGRYYLNQYTSSGEVTAKQNFQEALLREPDCVPALAGLAISNIHDFEGYSTTDPEKHLMAAWQIAERATTLDETDSHARYALANALFFLGGHDLAIQHCSRALDSNPNDYHNLCSQGWFLTFGGEVKKGLACNARAISLNPYAPNGCLMVAGFGKIIEGDITGAVQTLSAIRADNMFKQGGLAACYSKMDRPRDSELAAAAFRHLADEDFPDDAKSTFERTKGYWRRMFKFARTEDEECFFGALNAAGIPV